MSNYVHHIPGRVRIRVKDVKQNEARASSLKRMIESAEGVKSVEINTLTGSVLIRYDTATTDSSSLLGRLGVSHEPQIPIRRATPSVPSPAPLQNAIGKAVAKAVISYAAEKAVERSVLMLLAAVL